MFGECLNTHMQRDAGNLTTAYKQARTRVSTFDTRTLPYAPWYAWPQALPPPGGAALCVLVTVDLTADKHPRQRANPPSRSPREMGGVFEVSIPAATRTSSKLTVALRPCTGAAGVPGVVGFEPGLAPGT